MAILFAPLLSLNYFIWTSGISIKHRYFSTVTHSLCPDLQLYLLKFHIVGKHIFMYVSDFLTCVIVHEKLAIILYDG